MDRTEYLWTTTVSTTTATPSRIYYNIEILPLFYYYCYSIKDLLQYRNSTTASTLLLLHHGFTTDSDKLLAKPMNEEIQPP